MKTYKISLAMVLILGVIYFVLDRHLFYFGKNDLNIYGSLPLKIKPVFRYDFEGGFAIEDNYGFFLISSGKHKYVGSEVEINIEKVIKYGIDDERLVAHIEDTIGNEYYIKFRKDENPQSKQDILISVLTEKEEIKFDSYRWFKIQGNEKLIRTIELSRNYLLIVLILLIMFIVVKKISSRSQRISTEKTL